LVLLKYTYLTTRSVQLVLLLKHDNSKICKFTNSHFFPKIYHFSPLALMFVATAATATQMKKANFIFFLI
jgi:hypothetical protein